MNRREYQKQYYQANKERKKLYMREYRRRTREKRKTARILADRISKRQDMEHVLTRKVQEYLNFVVSHHEQMSWSVPESKARLTALVDAEINKV